MTETELIRTIASAIPKDTANAQEVASTIFQSAVREVGRIRNVHWNRRLVSFTLRSGVASYVVGVDILSSTPSLSNIQKASLAETPGGKVEIVDLTEFSSYASGSDETGTPAYLTVHGESPMIMEVWPIPDSDYDMEALVKLSITSLSEIPERYHDVVLDTALAKLARLRDPNAALAAQANAFAEVQNDSLTAWDGTEIPIERIYDQDLSASGSDSRNIFGE